MARTDDFSTTTMPRVLLALTLAFLAARIALSSAPPTAARTPLRAIAWTAFDDRPASFGRSPQLTLYEFRATWSEPCRRMEETVFENRQIAEAINKNFVPVQVTDRQKEDGKNPQKLAELEKKYHVFAFPTLVVAGPDGEAVSTLVGNASALSTFQFLTRATHAAAPRR